MDMNDLKAAIEQHGSSLKEFAEAAARNTDRITEVQDRLLDFEQKSAIRIKGERNFDYNGDASNILAKALTDADGFKALQRGETNKLRVQLPPGALNLKAALLNSTGSGADLADPHVLTRPVFATPRRLTIRSLLPVAPTDSASVEYPRETAFTNNAAPQYDASPGTREGARKAESGFTFTRETARVETIAHWIPASKQILSDVEQLQAYIGDRLTYGLALEEEDQLLNGDGTGANLNGLWNQATAYNRSVTGDSRCDTLRRAITQLQLGDNSPTGIILNPADLEELELLKDTTGQYLSVVVTLNGAATTWRLPIVPTNSMTQGRFLVADFNCAQIWDRQEAFVGVAEQHDDFFIRNMVAILCEERIAFTVYKPAAFIKGTF